MIGGTNRSGKTTMLNNILASACETYSPEQLRLWLFDFKEGVSFNIYHAVPHVEVLYTDNRDKDYLHRAFEAFISAMEQRAQLFKQCRPPVATLVRYNSVAEQPLPRLVMVVDEAQSLFDERVTKVAAQKMIREISRKGAAFGLHMILMTQSYQNVDLDRDAQGQFRTRIGLQLATSMECRALMGRDNDAPMDLPRFHAIYNDNNGDARSNRRVRLDPLEDEELFRRLDVIRLKYPDHGGLLVFEQEDETSQQVKMPKTAAIAKELPEWLR
jgi:DNA segregation ATPase FtsK/SpoIIIE-like protein